MTLAFALLILFVFSKYIIRCSSRKSYLITGFIITAVLVLSNINTLISNPMYFLKYESWQILIAFIIYLVYVFRETTSIKRNRSFNKKIRTKTKPYFNTAKANGLYFILISILILLVGIALLIIKITKVYEDISYVVFIGSAVGFIGLFITGIIYIKLANEKFILIIKTNDEFYVYEKQIGKEFRFNYMDYISDIYKYYIIEKLGVFKYSGDTKEIHYVWILWTENLKNYDISKLPMEKTNNYWYNEIVDDAYKFRNTKFNIEIEKNRVKNIKLR